MGGGVTGRCATGVKKAISGLMFSYLWYERKV